MKIYKIILTLFLLFTLFVSGQTKGVIVYKEILNLGVPVERQWALYFDSKSSINVEIENTMGDKKIDSSINESQEMVINLDIKEFYLASLENNILTAQGAIATKPYLIEEGLPKIEWELLNENKTISGFHCQKAIGSFRGRIYTVWFTNQVPTPFGPWKLFGLPGAILEFEDKSGQIYSSAVKVTINENSDVDEIIKLNKGEGKVINLEEYVKLKQNENELMLKYAMTKLGREAEIFDVAPAKRRGFELKFEWEENKE